MLLNIKKIFVPVVVARGAAGLSLIEQCRPGSRLRTRYKQFASCKLNRGAATTGRYVVTTCRLQIALIRNGIGEICRVTFETPRNSTHAYKHISLKLTLIRR